MTRFIRIRAAFVLVIMILLPDVVLAQGGRGNFLQYVYNAGGLALQLYRVRPGSLSSNFVGTQTIQTAGNSVVTGFYPASGSTAPYFQTGQRQALPLAGAELRRLGGYNQLHMPNRSTPVYLPDGTTSFWEFLTQQLSGSQQQVSSMSNPLHNAGEPQNVVQQLLENPADYDNSGNLPDAQNMITGETTIITGADGMQYPVCNVQTDPDSDQSARAICSQEGISGRHFIQFTPMTGQLLSHFYHGIGFVNTDDGMYMFILVLMRGGSFSCKPQEDQVVRRNKSDDDPNGFKPRSWTGKATLDIGTRQPQSTY